MGAGDAEQVSEMLHPLADQIILIRAVEDEVRGGLHHASGAGPSRFRGRDPLAGCHV